MKASPVVRRQGLPLALIVESDASVRDLLVDIVSECGWRAQPTELACLPAVVGELRPRLLLIEAWKQDPAAMSEATRALLRAPWAAQLRVVLTSTNHCLLDAIAFQMRQQPVAVLTKPFDFDQLLVSLAAAREYARREVGWGAQARV